MDGGAILDQNQTHDAIITHCCFRNCIASNFGGAIYLKMRNITLARNSFLNCSASNGLSILLEGEQMNANYCSMSLCKQQGDNYAYGASIVMLRNNAIANSLNSSGIRGYHCVSFVNQNNINHTINYFNIWNDIALRAVLVQADWAKLYIKYINIIDSTSSSDNYGIFRTYNGKLSVDYCILKNNQATNEFSNEWGELNVDHWCSDKSNNTNGYVCTFVIPRFILHNKCHTDDIQTEIHPYFCETVIYEIFMAPVCSDLK